VTGESFPQFKTLLLDLQLNHIQLPPRVVEKGEHIDHISYPAVQDDFISSAALTYLSHKSRNALNEVYQVISKYFCEDIYTYIDVLIISYPLQELGEYTIARKSFLQNSLLYDELVEVFIANGRSTPSNAELSLAENSLLASDAVGLLQIQEQASSESAKNQAEKGSENNLFGLSSAQLLQDVAPPAEVGATVLPHLEVQISQKMQTLLQFSQHIGLAGNDVEKRRDLYALIEEKLSASRDLEKQLWLTRTYSDMAAFETLNTLGKILSLASTIVKQYKSELQIAYDLALSESLVKRCQTITTKISLLRYSFIRETYSAETVAALRKVRYGMLLSSSIVEVYYSRHCFFVARLNMSPCSGST
tara:strand:+ start:151 stop:1236 length:1086 start_codon:yes stop_codon:yes gene_type:complete